MSAEVWQHIPSAPGYEASSEGRIRSFWAPLPRGISVDSPARRIDSPRQVTLIPSGHGYFHAYVHDTTNGRRKEYVHRLVAEAFHGDPTGWVVRHLNGERFDNRAVNLAIGTASENSYDTVRHGHHKAAAATHCKRGHEFTAENTWTQGARKHRRCRACFLLREALYRAGRTVRSEQAA